MARVNVSIPDEVIEAARARGLNVSAVATAALAAEVARKVSVERVRAELEALDASLGPVPASETEAAAAWVRDLLASAEAEGDG